MDENNQEQMQENKHTKCFMCSHPIFKHILVGLMVFLGTFAAFYVVTDWHYKRMLDPIFQMKKMDKMMMREARQMDRIAHREMKRGLHLEHKAGQIIQTEKNDDAYRIIINLKPFDNDEKNVEVLTEGNKLTINAAGETKKRNKNAIIHFTQSFIFPDDAILSEISKYRADDKYIIEIPIENED